MLVVISNKCVCLGRRNFYCEENCPKWFPKDVVFRRPNHPKGIIALAFVTQALYLDDDECTSQHYIAGEKRMQAEEMRRILTAFLHHCPDQYKMCVG